MPSSIRPPDTWSAVVAGLGQDRRVAEARRRDHRAEPQRARARGQRVDRRPRVQRAALGTRRPRTGSGRSGRAPRCRSARRRRPARPSPPRSRPPGPRSSGRPASARVIPSRAVPRSLVWSLYGCLVLVWSSTWVVIAVGLDGVAPFLGAGIRFALAGLGVLAAARALGRPLKTDWRLAGIVGVLPFATTYGLIYWAEQYVPSGLTAVLFGVPAALRGAAGGAVPARGAAAPAAAGRHRRGDRRPRAGVRPESLHLGGRHAALAAAAVVLSPMASAIGNISIKRRGARVDPLAHERLGDAASAASLLLARVRADRGLGRDGVVGGLGALDPLPRRVRHRLHVRHADDPDPRAARRDHVVHLAA